MRLNFDYNDVFIIKLLIFVFLYSPYIYGDTIRFDHIFLILLFSYLVFVRFRGRFQLPQELKVYAVFLLYITVTTFVKFIYMDSVGSVLSMIAAMDAYMRPLYIMMIMSSMSISRKDLYEIFRYLLMVSVPVLLVGVMQFMPFIADSINDMLLNYYTGRSEYLCYQLAGLHPSLHRQVHMGFL